MGGSRGRGRGKRKRRWNWRFIAVSIFVLGFFSLGAYIAQLYGQISALIEQRSAGLASAIYSAPTVVVRGEDIARTRLPDRLHHLSYSEVDHVTHPGEYSESPDAMTVYFRAADLGTRKLPATLVRLTLDGSTVTGIADDFGMPLKHATLEPEVIGRLYPGAPAERVEVPLSELKPYLVRGLIATEDRFFYYHFGFDPIRIIEAALADWRSHRLAQGASTITQQLARTFMGEHQRSFSRKLREAAVALVIEIRLSKRQILERYINDVPMGSYDGAPIDGLPLAARYLFNKDLSEVTPAEAAMLIGMIQAPTLYDPRRHPEAAARRRDVVLAVMRDAGVIDEAAYLAASSSPIKVAKTPGLRRAPYFDQYVTNRVQKLPGFHTLRGLRVYTTLDAEMESEAQDAVTGNLRRLEKLYPALRRHDPAKKLESSLIAIDAFTGAIAAMVGGRDYAVSQYNRAVMAERQPGSAFKPIVYLTALDPSRSPLHRPITLATLLPDRPMSFGGWTPANYERNYRGQVTVVDALAKSLNVPTAYLGSLLGARNMVRTAHEMGVSEKLPAVLPIAIGADEMTLLELTAAYQAFADEGTARSPYAIKAVVDARGDILYQHNPAGRRLIKPQVAYLITAALENVMRYGTGAGAARLGVDFPAAGKTGTTENYHDAYFVGYTPALVCGVWVGFDQPRSIGLTGARAALPAWAHFMDEAAPRGLNFQVPRGLVFATIDPDSGGLATPACPRKLRLPFLPGTQPTVYCALHNGAAPSVTTASAGAITPGTASGANSGAAKSSGGFIAGVGHFFGSIFGHR